MATHDSIERRSPRAVCDRAAIAIAIVAVLAAASFAVPLGPQVTLALTQIDVIATKPQLENAIAGPDALDHLIALAEDPAADFGVRLRAIAALPLFCPAPGSCGGTPAHVALRTMLSTSDSPEPKGQAILRRRAAIYALGRARTGAPEDVALLITFLDDASRDVRAATAHALRDLCNTLALPALRARYASEQTLQVRIAISDALRVLDQCGGP